MTADRHARVKQLFLAAIELPPSERGPWLENACADDLSLRPEVEALLAQQTAESSKPARPATPLTEDRGRDDAIVNLDARNSEDSQAILIRNKQSRNPVEEQERPPGTMIADRYRIVSQLGVGGMGIVYRADDLTLDQAVAIKFLPSLVATNPAWLARFRNEARLARTVTHPNVCRVHDLGEADGEHFITMEFVAGEDLANLLRQIGRFPSEKAVDIARQVCAGLAAAHRAGVLHRDLKPANIMLDGEGNARITDFGIAGLSGQIAAGEIRAGTPAYMAPEQITGRDVTLESDIYALGLVLYELFSGRPAYQAASLDEYLRLHETTTPTPLSEIVADLPDGIEEIVDQCLQKDSDKRPRSALHVAAALPGTDVLRLALASDMTPSPDLIAVAAAKTGGPNHRMWLMIAAVSLLASLVFLRSAHPIQWDDLGTSPPAALAERARRVLETAGLAVPDAYEAFGYCATEDAWRPMVRAFAGEDIAVKVVPTTAAEPCFFFRQSARPLVSATLENVFWRAGYVAPWDPPLAEANSRAVLFDKAGRLILLGVAPNAAARESNTGDVARVNEVWTGLLRAAGIDADRADALGKNERSATGDRDCTYWNVPETPQPNGPASDFVGCSSRRGPTFFAAGTPPNERPLDAAGETIAVTSQRSVVITAQRVLFLALLAIAVPFGILKLRTAKIDYQGVVRLAVVVVLMEIIAAVLRVGSSATFYDGLSRLCMAVVRAVGIAGLLGVFYLAVDAYARRLWPHLLVTWNRLLLRRFGDPDVRFHTLVGVCVGCWWAFAAAAERAIVNAWGMNIRPMFGGERIAEKLHGFVSALASYFGCVEQALIYGLLFLLLLVVVRTWIRHPTWAAVVCTLVLAPIVVPRGAHAYTAWLAMGFGGAAVGVWIMVRYGLLAIVVAIFAALILNTTPMNVSSRAWTVSISMCAILIVVCLIAYGIKRGGGASVKPRHGAASPA